jgi:hypothetical protein
MYQSLVSQGKLLVSLGLFGLMPPCVDIGQRAQAPCIVPGEKRLVLEAPNQLSFGFEFTAEKIRYLGVVQDKCFVFISTNDPKFHTPEGVSIFTTLQQLPRTTTTVHMVTGWAQVCRLPSGWNCAFYFSETLKPTSHVAYFYKNKFSH